MRRLAPCLLLVPLVLAGCGEKPDFDARYAEQEKKLDAQAKALGKELDRRMTEKPGLEKVEPLDHEEAAKQH